MIPIIFFLNKFLNFSHIFPFFVLRIYDSLMELTLSLIRHFLFFIAILWQCCVEPYVTQHCTLTFVLRIKFSPQNENLVIAVKRRLERGFLSEEANCQTNESKIESLRKLRSEETTSGPWPLITQRLWHVAECWAKCVALTLTQPELHVNPESISQSYMYHNTAFWQL